ncbi:MAG: VCBS repeat-containing protein, partial [Ignavibacteria bacterium]
MSFFEHSFVKFILISLFPVSIIGQSLSFDQHPIDLTFEGIHAVKVVDLDDDGDLDIVGGSEIGPSNNSIGIHWLRNDGGDPITWTRIEVDASFEHVMSVDVGNINNDDYPDIVATSWSLHQVAWWENSGDPNQGWSKKIIISNFYNAHDAKCSDIDQDGDTDIISASHYSNSILISLNNGNTPVSWQHSYLTTSFAGAQRVLITDLDKDNDPDILGTATDAGEVAWWRNLGGNPLTWSKTVI